MAFHSPETVGSWHARWSDRVQSMTWKPCSGSGASVFRHWPNGTLAVAGYAVLAGYCGSQFAAREAGHAVREMERWMVPNNSGRQRDAATITQITRKQPDERVIFRKSECGQRAGIWAMSARRLRLSAS